MDIGEEKNYVKFFRTRDGWCDDIDSNDKFTSYVGWSLAFIYIVVSFALQQCSLNLAFTTQFP